MNFRKTLLLINIVNAQEYTINFNVDTANNEIKKVTDIWHNYLRSNSKEYWKYDEVKKLENFNIQNMPSILNPPLLNWKLNNRILSVSNLSDTKYLLKSVFYNNDLEVFYNLFSFNVFLKKNVLIKKIDSIK